MNSEKPGKENQLGQLENLQGWRVELDPGFSTKEPKEGGPEPHETDAGLGFKHMVVDPRKRSAPPEPRPTRRFDPAPSVEEALIGATDLVLIRFFEVNPHLPEGAPFEGDLPLLLTTEADRGEVRAYRLCHVPYRFVPSEEFEFG
jgi:hypothetical protein